MSNLQTGRLIDHVHLVVHDLEASKRFYRAALAAVGCRSAAKARITCGPTSCTSRGSPRPR